MKCAVILCDGMADYAIESLGGKTPLEAAAHPTFDELCTLGRFGLANTIPTGMPPGSDAEPLMGS